MEFKKMFTTKHTGKMEGLISLSTTSAKNTFCQKMKTCKGSICQFCYTEKGFLKNVKNSKKLIDNYNLLTTSTLDWKNDVKNIDELNNYQQIRLESFGELENDLQLQNYLALASAFPNTTFTLWTKRTDLIKKNITTQNKPKNLILIVSSPTLNKPASLVGLSKVVDKVFTVYEKGKHKNINCGKAKCATCKLCYTHNKTRYINEELK